jgi:hypothetical protein
MRLILTIVAETILFLFVVGSFLAVMVMLEAMR